MTALRNADHHSDNNKHSATAMNAVALPESQPVCDGGATRYARDDRKLWYVLRTSYARTDRAKDILHDLDITYYLPMTRGWKGVGQKRRKCMLPLLPSLIFVYSRPELVRDLMIHPHNNVLSYYFNHCDGNGNGYNSPLTVPYASMMNFILATCSHREHLVLLGDQSAVRYLSRQRVRVTDGPFAGVEGYVVRAAGQQRVLVELEGIAAIGTAYVPTYWLQTI